VPISVTEYRNGYAGDGFRRNCLGGCSVATALSTRSSNEASTPAARIGNGKLGSWGRD